jgi:hypothetical protein
MLLVSLSVLAFLPFFTSLLLLSNLLLMSFLPFSIPLAFLHLAVFDVSAVVYESTYALSALLLTFICCWHPCVSGVPIFSCINSSPGAPAFACVPAFAVNLVISSSHAVKAASIL